MCSFEVHYVDVAQKITVIGGANMANIGKNGHISPPITLLVFKLHQHNVPQKNTFFIYNWGLINKNIV